MIVILFILSIWQMHTLNFIGHGFNCKQFMICWAAMKYLIMFLDFFFHREWFSTKKIFLKSVLLIYYDKVPLILSSANILQFTMYWSFGLSAALLHLLHIYLFTFSLWRHISELYLPPQDFVYCKQQWTVSLALTTYWCGGNIKNLILVKLMCFSVKTGKKQNKDSQVNRLINTVNKMTLNLNASVHKQAYQTMVCGLLYYYRYFKQAALFI